MTYEVEVRAFVIKERLENVRETIKRYCSCNKTACPDPIIYVYKTFLINKPSYLRIRTTKGQNCFIVTRKYGDYNDPSRKEINKKYPLKEFSKTVAELKSKGFDQGVYLNSRSESFRIGNIKVEINEHDLLGNFVEIEGMARTKQGTVAVKEEVRAILKSLVLEELSGGEYQNMMDNMYSEHTVSLDKFTLASIQKWN